MPTSPLVSIIISTHNRSELLPDALVSVTAQSLTDWEMIIVDDASKPAVNAKALQTIFGKKCRILRHNTPQGSAAAKNTGVNIATGKYLAFLNDDDALTSNYLTLALEALENRPYLKTLFMGVACFGENSELLQEELNSALDKTLKMAQGDSENGYFIEFNAPLFPALLADVPPPFQRPVTTKAHFLQVGGYQNDCLLSDSDWALRAALAGSCALLNVGLYLQRAEDSDDLALISNLERKLSAFSIKKQLLNDPRAILYKEPLTEAVKQSAHELIDAYKTQGRNFKAFTTLISSLRYGMSLAQFNQLLRDANRYTHKN